MTNMVPNSLTAYARITAMVIAINEFRIDLIQKGKSFAEIHDFLNGLHVEFEMLIKHISDRGNALRAQNIGGGVTLLEAQLRNRDLFQIEGALSEIQTELTILQMVLPDKIAPAEQGNALPPRAKEYLHGRINYHNP